MNDSGHQPLAASRGAIRARVAWLLATPLIILFALGCGYWLGRLQTPRTPPLPIHPAHGEKRLIGFDQIETLEFERAKPKVRAAKYPK